MKTYQTNPKFSIIEFMTIDKTATCYNAPPRPNNIYCLLSTYALHFPRMNPHDSIDGHITFFVYYACLFLFECGRIYGIRQERARRRGRQSEQSS